MAREPSDAQFADLVCALWPSLYRTAHLMLGDHQLAEDLAQSALTTAYASWGRIRDPQAAPACSQRVLAATAASWFRRRSWRNERPSADLSETGWEGDTLARPMMLERWPSWRSAGAPWSCCGSPVAAPVSAWSAQVLWCAVALPSSSEAGTPPWSRPRPEQCCCSPAEPVGLSPEGRYATSRGDSESGGGPSILVVHDLGTNATEVVDVGQPWGWAPEDTIFSVGSRFGAHLLARHRHVSEHTAAAGPPVLAVRPATGRPGRRVLIRVCRLTPSETSEP